MVAAGSLAGACLGLDGGSFLAVVFAIEWTRPTFSPRPSGKRVWVRGRGGLVLTAGAAPLMA